MTFQFLLWIIMLLALVGFVALMNIYPTLYDRFGDSFLYNILDALVYFGMIACIVVIGAIVPNLKIGW